MSYFIKVNCLGEGDFSHSEEITIVKANQNKDLVVEDLKTILSSINSTLSSFKENDELYEFNYVLKIVYNHEMVMQVIEGERMRRWRKVLKQGRRNAKINEKGEVYEWEFFIVKGRS